MAKKVAKKVDKAQDDPRQKGMASPLFWFAVYCRIKDKLGNKIAPKPNVCQIRLFLAYEDAIRRGVPFRAIVLKPRKVGISTASVALAYWHMRLKRYFAAIMADSLERSDTLFRILRFIAENDTLDWGDSIRPVFTEDVGKFGNARAQKYTAERPTASRGETPQVAVITEAAFYPEGGARDAEETLTGLLNSIPKEPDTIVIEESTAKGFSGVFAKDWRRARWPRFLEGKLQYWKRYVAGTEEEDEPSDYVRIFMAWWEEESYALDLTNPAYAEDYQVDRMMATLSPDEKDGIAAYKWTWEQIAWRRNTIKNECGGSVAKFKEEYPSSPDEPFAMSGSPVFDADGLAYLQRYAMSQQYSSGTLSDIAANSVPTIRPQFIPAAVEQSWVQLWEIPKIGCSYLVVSDVAEDKDMNPGTASQEVKRDNHSGGVLRAGYTDDRLMDYRPKMVGRVLPPCKDGHDLYAMKLFKISRFFGNCPIVVEMNNHGVSVARELRKLGANLFTTTMSDPINQSKIVKVGFRTDPKTRPAVINGLAASVRKIVPVRDPLNENAILEMEKEALEIPDVHAISEMRTFVVDKHGDSGASPGNHDDDVMMLAIGWYLIGAATKYNVAVVPRKAMPGDYKVVSDPKERGHSDLPTM